MNIRANVRKMVPYTPGKPIAEVQRELGLDRVIKLASNENPLGPSPMAVAAMKVALDELNIYPDGAAYELKQAITKKFGVPADQIMVGNGSDELIHFLGLVLLENEDDEVIVGHPSFIRYDAAAHLAPCKLIQVPLDENLKHDLPAMAAKVTDKTKLLFIANPNNPTGTIVRKPEMDAFLRDLPKHVVVVLDEAYIEFAQHLEDFPVSTEYLKQGYNVVGLRTFSKTYGLAGIRVGYGFGPAELVDAVNRVREPFNVNSLGLVAGVAALQDDEHLRNTVENNRRGQEILAGVFAQVGAKVYESYANFVFADLNQPAAPVFRALLEKGVIVRPGEIFGKPTCLRVTIGTPEENEFFAQTLLAVCPAPAAWA